MSSDHNKASEWFDVLYKEHEKNHENIPWARKAINPFLQSYLDETIEHKGKALIIGCGLGDDAYALDKAGYDVLAIDVSQTALNIAKERFPDSKITFEKQDIFDMPQKYNEYFDFVFEAFTVQSLPIKFRKKMVKSIVSTLAPEGRLLLVAHQKEQTFEGPPWPLTLEDVSLFKCEGLNELSHEIHQDKHNISNSKFRVLYSK